MERSEISIKFKQIVADELETDVDVAELQDYKTFRTLGADSINVLNLVVEAEKEFDIQIPDEDVEKLDTIGKTIDYIQQKAK
ncbi:hypothetical protein AUC61_25705 [Pseudomonas sp. S25]|uniref:Acyl carrier protein n=1 Tax=Pseudomonas maioricensis TaxID=1766623 RepID=A0ABS9ZQU1_9PSED|nr:acyl carrier protein [Pseudomonas sp. S25]MCI8212934.1 hypothetical protein [Pseudomonas sp. S25]